MDSLVPFSPAGGETKNEGALTAVNEKTKGTDSSETRWRDLETKSIFRLCIYSKSQLISRPRRRQLKFSKKVRTVSAQSPKAAAAP